MPSPGNLAILQAITNLTYEAADGVETTLTADSPFVRKLATALHTGWTSAYPSSPTTAANAISAEFSGFKLAPQSLQVLVAMGTGIDSETALWVASYNATTGLHSYAPQQASIVAKILAACPVQYPSVQVLADAVAAVFVAHFEQEGG